MWKKISKYFFFILMLINVRISESSNNSNSIPLAIMIGIFFNVTLYKLLPTNLSSIFNIYAYSKAASVNNMSYSTHYTPISIKDLSGLASNNDISFVSSHIWDGALAETSHITSIGNILYTSYPLWLLITSIILLLAMVGAIVITIKSTDNKV